MRCRGIGGLRRFLQDNGGGLRAAAAQPDRHDRARAQHAHRQRADQHRRNPLSAMLKHDVAGLHLVVLQIQLHRRVRRIAAAGKAPSWIAVQAPQQRLVHVDGHALQRGDGLQLVQAHLPRAFTILASVALLQRQPSAVEQLVDHHRERIDVHAAVSALAMVHLRRHVIVGAIADAAFEGGGRNGCAKIAELEVIRPGRIEHVVRLDVGVQNRIFFAHTQRRADLLPDVQHPHHIGIAARREARLLKVLAQDDQLFHAYQHIPAAQLGVRALYDPAVLEIGDIALALQPLHDLDLSLNDAQLLFKPRLFALAAHVRTTADGILVNRNHLDGRRIAAHAARAVPLLAVDRIYAAKGAPPQYRVVRRCAVQPPLTEEELLVVFH